MTIQIKLDENAKLAVKDLAVAYCSYNSLSSLPRTKENLNAIAVWGNLLIESQKQLGVELCPETTISLQIKYARAAYDKLAA